MAVVNLKYKIKKRETHLNGSEGAARGVACAAADLGVHRGGLGQLGDTVCSLARLFGRSWRRGVNFAVLSGILLLLEHKSVGVAYVWRGHLWWR